MQATTRYGANIFKCKYRRSPVVIEVLGDIDENTASEFCRQMAVALAAGQPIVPVVISSPGGDPYPLLSMINAIRQCPVPVATIVTGFAASCAAILFTWGHPQHRYMAPDARIMVHSVSATLGQLTTAAVVSEAAETRRLNARLSRMMDENCGKPRGFFARLMKQRENTDVWLTSSEAIAMGIASSNEMPLLVTRIEAVTTLETTSGRVLPIAVAQSPVYAAPIVVGGAGVVSSSSLVAAPARLAAAPATSPTIGAAVVVHNKRKTIDKHVSRVAPIVDAKTMSATLPKSVPVNHMRASAAAVADETDDDDDDDDEQNNEDGEQDDNDDVAPKCGAEDDDDSNEDDDDDSREAVEEDDNDDDEVSVHASTMLLAGKNKKESAVAAPTSIPTTTKRTALHKTSDVRVARDRRHAQEAQRARPLSRSLNTTNTGGKGGATGSKRRRVAASPTTRGRA